MDGIGFFTYDELGRPTEWVVNIEIGHETVVQWSKAFFEDWKSKEFKGHIVCSKHEGTPGIISTVYSAYDFKSDAP